MAARIRVHCDKHRPQKYRRTWEFEECEKEECQELMAARREAVKAAHGPTEEEQRAWVDWLPGRATQKVTPTGGKA